MSNAVIEWFGGSFADLHPLLQGLHREGGVVSGEVELVFPAGLAGLIGLRVARKLGLPVAAGLHSFRVDISHREGSLHWARNFNSQADMVSVFVPHGSYPSGYWSESTGALTMHLGVKIIDGGWYWVQRKLMYRGITLPLWLFPSTEAYKRIVDGNYEFSVCFSLPLFGEILRYKGTLDAEPR